MMPQPYDNRYPATRIRDEFNSLLQRFLQDPFFQTKGYAPAINLIEEKERFVVEAELPGIAMHDLEIEIHGNQLVIKGERKEELKNSEGKTHIVESRHGSFYRSLTIPDNIDTDKVTAESSKGMVYIYLPKSGGSKPRRVQVKEK